MLEIYLSPNLPTVFVDHLLKKKRMSKELNK